MERQEQYSRRNCILIHVLKEEKNESTDDRVLKLFKEELSEIVLKKKETQAANHVQLL